MAMRKNTPVRAGAPGSRAGSRSARLSRGKLPYKRSINLRLEDETAIDWRIAIPGILVILCLACLFSKFFVVDRLTALSRAERRVTLLEEELARDYELMNTYADIKDDYAHYTYSGFTEAELARTDRVQVLRLVSEYFHSGEISRNWFLSDNVLTVEVSGGVLEDLNRLAQRIEQDPIVDRCIITNAVKKESDDSVEGVKATFIVYLQESGKEAGKK